VAPRKLKDYLSAKLRQHLEKGEQIVPSPTLTRRELLIAAGATASSLAFPATNATEAANTAPVSGATSQGPAGSLAAARTALDRYVPAYLKTMNAPGMTMGLATRDGALQELAYGWSNREAREPVSAAHLFQIGSITKSFVGLVLLQLQDEGKLEIARPILDYLPWLPIEQPFGPIAVHHLLTHTSGLASESPPFPAGGARLMPHYAPGQRFHYSNWAYDTLGTLIEQLDGQPWPQAVERRIFAPLGMTASTGAITGGTDVRAARSYVRREDAAIPRNDALALVMAGPLPVTRGAGSIASTAGDMTRYMRMLLDRGAGPRGLIVSEGAFETFVTGHVPAPDWGEGVHYGYGIAIEMRDGERVLRHTGGMVSFMSSMQVNLDAGVGAFASINAQQNFRPNRVTGYALASMRASQRGESPPPEPVADERDAPEPDDYVGTYTNAAGRRLQIVADGPQLLLLDGLRRVPLEHIGGDQFVAPDPAFAPHQLVFERAQPAANAGTAAAGATGDARTRPAVEILGHGEQSYFHSQCKDSRADSTTPELRALQGTYRCDDPWIGTTRIVARRGQLWMQGPWEGPVPLLPDGADTFRVYDLDSPDVVRFDAFVEGRPQVLWLGGVAVARASA
jgi:CubicO group peptidase (beta-lactamase class C family)